MSEELIKLRDAVAMHVFAGRMSRIEYASADYVAKESYRAADAFIAVRLKLLMAENAKKEPRK